MYWKLVKPGIIMGNLITAMGGFFLGRGGHGFVQMMVGLGFVIAAACVCNNYIDRESDQKMERTKNRPVISLTKMFVLASSLGLIGFSILLTINMLTALIAFVGFFVYVFLYSFIKYHSDWAALVGSVSGALPPVVGYCAATGRLDGGAFLLFSMLVFWQMPHFYAIALYRVHDYAAAGIPVLPITKGVHKTKVEMTLYVAAFLVTASLLTIYTSYTYLAIAILLGGSWLILSLKGFKAGNDTRWARQMFILSLIAIVGISATLALRIIL